MDAAEPTTLPAFIRSYPFRLALYGVAAVVVFQLVGHGVEKHGAAHMGRENGPLEASQALLALFASLCLFYAASRVTVGRAGLIICAAMMGYAAARESDELFESLFFDDSYKWLVGLPLFTVVMLTVFARRQSLVSDVMSLMREPSATLFIVAGIYLCGVCQVLDRPGLWTSISVPADAMTTKAVIEEFSELFAYLLLAFSGIEAVVLARRTKVVAAADSDVSEPPVRLAA